MLEKRVIYHARVWLQEGMADGSMVVSLVSGLINPADIGIKRLNVHRMTAMMFLLGMFDTMNKCLVKTQKHVLAFNIKS